MKRVTKTNRIKNFVDALLAEIASQPTIKFVGYYDTVRCSK